MQPREPFCPEVSHWTVEQNAVYKWSSESSTQEANDPGVTSWVVEVSWDRDLLL